MFRPICGKPFARRVPSVNEMTDETRNHPSSHPSPAFSPLDKAVVIERLQPNPGDGGIIGEHGIIIWRSSYFVEKSRYGTSGWLYVVYFPQSDAYDAVEESRLALTGEVVPLASCLGREYEISYDRDRTDPEALTGTFRTPGGFWNTFEFRCAAVEEPTYEIRIPMRATSVGIAKYEFAVPQNIPLACEYIEEMMSKELGAKEWRRICGPESKWFY